MKPPKGTWPDNLVAHTPNDAGDWHYLMPHLRGVGSCAEEFAGAFGMADVGRLLGLSHDLGKAAPAFQRYLMGCAAGRPPAKVPHSPTGAAGAADVLDLLALVVLGHHAGLPALSELKERLRGANPEGAKAARDLKNHLGLTRKRFPDWVNAEPRAAEMLVRFLLSALTDADRLDSEAADKPKPRGGYLALGDYRDALERHLAGFADDGRAVTRVRREVQADCRNPVPSGFYRLTVPTGGGKTLASLLFALHHATQALTRKRRIVTAIPYTSIIEQNAGVFRHIFRDLSPDAVLEHHSAVEAEDDEDPRLNRRKLAAENWDHPLIVTTNAQLFDSLFARKPSKVRKLHRLAESVNLGSTTNSPRSFGMALRFGPGPMIGCVASGER